MNDTAINLNEFTDKLFVDVVGQDGPKRALSMYLDYYAIKRHVPNTIFLGQRGNGKTLIAKKFGTGLCQFDANGKVVMENHPTKGYRPKPRKFWEINCSTIGGIEAFKNLLMDKVHDKDVTMFFDESHDIHPDVTTALLSIMHPDKLHTEFVHKDFKFDFDWTRQTFLFATTEGHKIFHALMDRLKKIALQEYSLPELTEILRRALARKGITCENKVLELAADVARCNARGAEKIAEDMIMFLCGRLNFTMSDWKSLSYTMTIRPLGIDNNEMAVMRYLQNHVSGVPLNTLAAKMGMTGNALMKDIELHLKRHDLLEVTTTGRALTAKGIQYLKDLDSGVIPTNPLAA